MLGFSSELRKIRKAFKAVRQDISRTKEWLSYLYNRQNQTKYKIEELEKRVYELEKQDLTNKN